MASKHVSSIDFQDIERVRKENLGLREDLGTLREEIAGERKTHAQLLESFQACHNEDARRLREEKKLTDTLAEENSQLRAEIKSIRQRNKGSTNAKMDGSSVGAQLLKELSALDKRLGLLHGDLMKSLFMKNVQGKDGTKAGEALALKEDFKKLTSELTSLRLLLSNGSISGGPNGLLVPALREGVKTKAQSSNSISDDRLDSPEDLVHLAGPITEDSIVRVLQQRSAAGHNYTNIGPMLILLNSFNAHPSEAEHQHLSSLVRTAVERLSLSRVPQVIVLSGCSASGKTFSSHVLAKCLLAQAGGGVESDVSKHFLASTVVLNSLGNAKTSTNSRSSRMGKFLEFHLSDGIVSRAKVNCYSLDSSRVVEQLPGERNFNIFYQLLAGITQEERAKVHLQGYSPHSLNYLGNCPVTNDREEADLKLAFDRWRTALVTLGIPFTDVLRILVAILLLGNIKFTDGEDVELDVKGNNEIKAVAALLGVSGVSLYRGLTTKTKNVRGQVFRTQCESAAANYTRDCLAKALYSRFVSAIVRRVNSYKRPNSMMSLSPQGSVESLRTPPGSPSPANLLRKSQLTSSGLLVTHNPGTPPMSPDGLSPQGQRGTSGMIDIVDMFGFENAQVNRLEQMCINLCSETIQHFYNTHIFKTSEEYCREEGLLSSFAVDYRDNAPCIELLTCQRVGVLTILDKESLFPRGTYQNFLQKVRVQHKDSECFFDPNLDNSCQFGITHYSGEVIYDASSLLRINRDTISDDIICVFSRQNCNFGFATHLFANDLRSQQGQAAGPKGALHRIACSSSEPHGPASLDAPQHTFSLDFQGRIDSLLKTLVQAQPLFVRCIKSNSTEEPDVFDRGVVSQQVRALQVFETLQLLQSGFAYHSRFSYFVNKYSFLARRRVRGREETGPEDCKIILETLLRKASRDKAKLIVGAWALGRRYVFYSEVVKQELQRLRNTDRVRAAVTVQAWVRGWLCRKRWHNQKRSLELQRKARQLPKAAQRIVRPVVSSTEELRVDTKSADQSCCLYGLDMETPPPVPKRRPYTVMGNMKMGFPQTRIMKYDYPDGEAIFKKGEAVKVVSSSDKRGYLVVEHKAGTCHVPFQCMELKASPHPSPR